MALGIESTLLLIAAISFVALILALVFRKFKQPLLIAYLLAGLLIGPYGLKLITDDSLISLLGELGVIILLFFLGMEVSLPHLLARWRVPVMGTILQIGVSVGLAFLLGMVLEWSFGRSLLTGFVISLSSTAVVIKLLEESGELHKRVGQDVLGVLLVQDLAIAPMIVLIGIFAGNAPLAHLLTVQVIVATVLISLVAYSVKRGSFSMPLMSRVKQDHELQIFGALLMCFGLAFLTGFVGLSPALGAFIAGILVSSAKQAAWIHDTLHEFKILFVALFFVSIGLLIDLQFFSQYWYVILILAFVVLITNTFLNAGILYLLGEPVRESLYFGSLLSQIGELSFVLAGTGLSLGLITGFGYQLTVSIIATTLVLSPAWILGARKTLSISI